MAVLDFLKRKPKEVKGKSKSSEFPYTRLKTVVDKIFTDTQTERDEMSRFLKRYKGEWWDKDKLKDTDSTIQANLFFSTVMTIAPLITDNRPIWSVRARAPYMQQHMEGFSLALEYLWDKLEMDAEVFKWILDALIMKIGIMKCHYDPDKEFGGEIALEVVDPRNFFCAPGYDDIWKSPLCGIRVKKPLSWIRTAYPDAGKNVKPDESEVGADVVADDAQTWELETKYATVYEAWLKDDDAEDYFIREEGGDEVEVDGKEEGAQKKSRAKYPSGRLLVFTKDALLDDKPSNYKHGKPPYVALYDYIVPHDLIGMGEGNQMEEINKSFNRNLQLIDAWTKFYCDPPWLLDTNAGLEVEKVKQQLLAGGGFFEHNGMSKEPLSKVPGANLDQAVPMYMNMLLKLNEEITGVTDITKGMTSKSQRQSATEISTLVESAYTRTRQRVRNFESSIKRVLYLMLENMQQFYTEPRKFSLSEDNKINYYTVSNSKAQAEEQMRPQVGTGETPEEDQQLTADYQKFIAEFGEVDEIYAAFDLEVQTNSSLPMDKQSLANLFLRLLEMAGGNPVTGMPMWEAALESLHIPRYKEITAKMQELFDKQMQGPPGAQGAPPGAETGGPPQLMELLQGAR